MHKTLLTSTLALTLGLAAEAQERKAPERTPAPTARPAAPPKATPPDAAEPARDDAAAKEAARKAAELQRLRAAFADEYLTRQATAKAEVEAAREATPGDEAAFAARRTEIARKHRGELAVLRTTYIEKATALGLTLELPTDEQDLARIATAAAPATVLRLEYGAKVAELARAASAEVAAAREAHAGDPAGFANTRNELARRYRGQVLALQQVYAEKAASAGVSVDTSDVSPVMKALNDAEAAAPRPTAPGRRPGTDGKEPAKPVDAAQPLPGVRPKPADGSTPPPDAPAPRPSGQPIDAEVLRTAFTKQVENLRGAMQGELATAEATTKGDALAAKRTEIAAKYRGQIATYRATIAARAQAAGVTLALPTDTELVPELGAEPAPAPTDPPKPPSDGVKPPKAGEDAAPPRAEPATGPGGKRGKAPRFGGGGG